MKWLSLSADILKNIEIQLPLDVYAEENQYSMISSFREKKDRKRISSNINDYQTVLIDNTGNSKEYQDISTESLVKKDNNSSVQTNLVDFGLKVIKKIKDDNMVKSFNKKDLMKKGIKAILGIDVVDEKKPEKLFIDTNGLVSLVKPICRRCGCEDYNRYGTDDRKLVKKDGDKEEYDVQGYICKYCGKTFYASLNNHINSESKDKKELYDKIEKIHGISGLSFDKIAKIIEITDNISISHTSVANIIERDLDNFEYRDELVILPQNFERHGKTSKKRKVTDATVVNMFKRKNIEISGDVIADEVFLDVIGKNEYLVSIMDQNISDMPIGVAVMKTRKFKAMKAFFDFVSEDNDLKFLTSDMLKVYGTIAKDKNMQHQQCVFHSMKYVGKYIFDVS
jgi:transposase-like protein